MSTATLYGFNGNPRTRLVQVVAAYEGISLNLEEVNVLAEGGAPASYKAKFPQGRIPAYEDGDFTLTECVPIATYLAMKNNKAGLVGSSNEETAQIQQWASWANMQFAPQIGGLSRMLMGKAQYNKTGADASKTAIQEAGKYLNNYLADKTYVVGEKISLGDIMIASVLLRGSETVIDDAFRKEFVNVTRHLNTVIRQPAFLSVIGSVPNFIEKSITYQPPKKEASAPKAAAPAAKPKEAAKPKPAADDEEEEAPAAPKAKHPAEALGPAKSFPLDEFKRQYSNKDTPDAFKWLEENFDAQEYSLWKVVYKYNDELTQVFMSANLIGGFHNRLEGSRKYLFGSAGVYGTNNNSKIAGAYMIRGSDAKSIFDVAPDFESYEYTPLDLKADKDYILGCWSWENEFDGLKYADGKVFK